jgi:hypothetical protein
MKNHCQKPDIYQKNANLKNDCKVLVTTGSICQKELNCNDQHKCLQQVHGLGVVVDVGMQLEGKQVVEQQDHAHHGYNIR